MLPIGNLTVFLSVPPSYQYLHSPFTIHHSHFTYSPITHLLIHSFTIHISPIHPFTHSIIHHSHFTYSPIHSFNHSPFTIHISLIHPFTHSPFVHPPTFLLVFFGKAPFYPKSTRRIIEQHPKESGNKVVKSGQTWTSLVKRGQTWTSIVKHDQTWTSMVKHGQNWSSVDKRGQTWTNMDKSGQIWSELVK